MVPDTVITRLRQELEDVLPGAGLSVEGLDLGT